ncbi:MAG: hypothetical protein PHN38_00245 [Sulfurospirillaceae bacterium]|nr:hypothetical protein [Sulfurospirillaceae bacterium]MDD3462211.1 hypothetical protein [Sulfurospirillaceae bacterium]
MTIEILGIICVASLVVILFLMSYIRDGEVNKKLLVYEKMIEDLNRQQFELKKTLRELMQKDTIDIKKIEKKIEDQIKTEVQNSVYPVLESIKEIEFLMQNFNDEQVERINAMEIRVKEVSCMPSSATCSNEKTIIAQYAKGKSEFEIAKDLRIGIGEVDLVLKLANLK